MIILFHDYVINFHMCFLYYYYCIYQAKDTVKKITMQLKHLNCDNKSFALSNAMRLSLKLDHKRLTLYVFYIICQYCFHEVPPNYSTVTNRILPPSAWISLQLQSVVVLLPFCVCVSKQTFVNCTYRQFV